MPLLFKPTLLLLSLILLATTCAGTAQLATASDKLVASIDKLVLKTGIHAGDPGVAILIREPGKLLFEKGYGLANVSAKTPISATTLFELASCSKPFTATAVLLLRDRGLLALEDDVQLYLPELPLYKRDNPIRIHDLLRHTSGLPEYFDFPDVPKRHKAYWNNEDYVPMFAKVRNDFPLQFPTGEKFDYCNSNFLLLAAIVARVSKKSFGQFLHDEVFIPAGMEHTFVYESPQSAPPSTDARFNKALGYEWKRKKSAWEVSWGTPPERQETMLIVGDGNVWTNLEDMAKWDIGIRARKLLKAETWKLAVTPSKTRNGKAFGYGLGWWTYFEGKGDVYGFGHDGTWSGFETAYYRYLSADRTTVILSNRDTLDTDELWTALDELVEKDRKRSKE